MNDDWPVRPCGSCVDVGEDHVRNVADYYSELYGCPAVDEAYLSKPEGISGHRLDLLIP